MAASIYERLALCPDLPSMPAVAMKVVEMGGNPDASLVELALAIGRDPALAVKVMRVAASPLYAGRRQVRDLRQALMVLGMTAAMSLALSFSLAGAWRSAQGPLDLHAYWRRCLVVAVATRAFGVRAGYQEREALFLAGLLQDIGMLALDRVLPGEYAGVLAWGVEDHAALVLGERAAFGDDHSAIGAWLLQRWRLPQMVVEAARLSHERDVQVLAQLPEVLRLQCAAVAVANAVAVIWCCKSDEDQVLSAVRFAGEALQLSELAVLDALSEVQAELPVMADLFEVEFGAAGMTNALLDQAREAMLVRNLNALQELEQLRQRTGQLEKVTQELEQQTYSDPLTGVSNRRWLEIRLRSEFDAATANAWPLSVLMVDLDGFKQINDRHGHAAGDAVLIRFASTAAGMLRIGDGLVRYGGDEFVVLLPGTDADGAEVVADRLRRCLQMQVIEGVPDGTELKASVGVATHSAAQPFANAEDILLAADRAMYRSKHGGKERHLKVVRS